MLRLKLGVPDDQVLDVLCIGAHSDDIEIGAGGTILTLLSQRPVRVRWVVFSSTEARAEEARSSARFFLSDAKASQIEVHHFRDGYFPADYADIKKVFEIIKRETSPHLILTHTRGDLHQDHKVLADLTWNTFRDHLILGYEIPKYDPDLGNPNLFVSLDPEVAERKVAGLMRYFESQHSRRWFVPETFHGLLRVRGLQAAAPSGLAEGFYGPKLWL
jgi:LmbE family N-acetylglucosaminyl deacetylase